MSSIHQLLVPVDASPTATKAMTTAIQLAHMRRLATNKCVACDSVLIEPGAGRVCDRVAEEARKIHTDMIVPGSSCGTDLFRCSWSRTEASHRLLFWSHP